MKGFVYRMKDDSWRARVPRLSRFALEHLLLLPLGALIALVWVNTGPESYYSFTSAISFAVNDVVMVFFFALMIKEVVEATAPGGVLHPWRRASLPVIASIGAMIVPALIYIRVVDALDEPVLAIGWPVPFATDVAVSYWSVESFPAASRYPVSAPPRDRVRCTRNIAVASVSPPHDVHLGGGVLILAIAWCYSGLRRARVKSFWPIWSRRGRFMVRALPRGASIRRSNSFRSCRSCLTRRAIRILVDALPEAGIRSGFEIWWRYPAQAALSSSGSSTLACPSAHWRREPGECRSRVIAGKPLGILMSNPRGSRGWPAPTASGWLARADCAGIHRRNRFQCRVISLRGVAASGQLRAEMRMGVLLSLAGAPLALVSARLLRVGRFAPQ